MKLELIVLLITGFIILNIYHEGKYIKLIKTWKKYYQMAFYAFLGLSLYIFMKKHPEQGKSLLSHANTFVKYMPMDKESGDFISPLLKISSNLSTYSDSTDTPQYRRMLGSGGGSNTINQIAGSNIKRSVSETKKKYIAANQNWKCAKCSQQLPAWFEVDHKIRLDRGGDNHVNNLEALCRECHGKKTTMESFI